MWIDDEASNMCQALGSATHRMPLNSRERGFHIAMTCRALASSMTRPYRQRYDAVKERHDFREQLFARSLDQRDGHQGARQIGTDGYCSPRHQTYCESTFCWIKGHHMTWGALSIVDGFDG
jgi:hypothetical protein